MIVWILLGNDIDVSIAVGLIVMIQKSWQALQHLDHVIQRQNRLFTGSSCKVLQTYHVSHGYDWTWLDSACQPVSVHPMNTCNRITQVWRCSAIGHTVHGPRLIVVSLIHAQLEIMEKAFVWYSSLKLASANRATKLSFIPYHSLKFYNVDGWLRWHKNQNQKLLFDDLGQVPTFEINTIYGTKVDILYA